MRAQIIHFDGPRSPEIVAAGEHAGRDRVTPAVLADAQVVAGHVATIVLRAPDGGEVVIAVADSDGTLDRAGEIINSTVLLPDEDPALLVGPDRVLRYDVVQVIERGKLTYDGEPAPTR